MQRYNYFFKLYIFEAKNLPIFIPEFYRIDVTYCVIMFC